MFRLILAAAFLLSACASTQRTLSYSTGWPDADVQVGGYRYQVWFHRTDQTLMIQRGEPRPMAQLLALNVTRYAADRTQPEAIWRAAANAVLSTIYCEAEEITGQDQMREVSFTCGPGVDVRQAVGNHRSTWQQGITAPLPAGS
jgi:hypothetical protein